MPTRRLPDEPSLEHLKSQAKLLRRKVRERDAQALAEIGEFDPGAKTDELSLTAAQLVIARKYGFTSWPKLRAHVDVIAEFSRNPEPAPDGAADTVDHFLQLVCLNYTRDTTDQLARAQQALDARPELAHSNIYAIAATGNAEQCRAALAADPTQVSRPGGPFNWEPLLYLAYSRLDNKGRSFIDTAKILLQKGASPDSGFLWRGMPSPFTALTGAFGGGEQNQPHHPDAVRLARVLLEAGADPNDNQALYNRMFTSQNDHLELLFEFGLGVERNGIWRRRLGAAYPTPTQMVQEQLRWAADHDMADRVRLLLDHGVAPDGRGYHPIYGDRTGYQLAVGAGNREIAHILAQAGAKTDGIDNVAQFLSACLAGDRVEVDRMIDVDGSLVARATAEKPELLGRAAETGRIAAVQILLELGWQINVGGRTALHQAAHDGNLPMARLLVEHGADRQRRDASFNGTPLGWAEYGRQQEMIEYLQGLDEI
ncbi:MAG TPA: ankyrin repeat domain-containing protein [Mycobacteriales bacterium]|nr:ankyrin repeat domain-containing protein [Mycobacteriales bacterium]